MDSDNYDEAVRLYQLVFKKAPDFDPVMRRLGSSLVMQGKTEEGLKLLEKAVQTNRSDDNLIAMAEFLAYPGGDKQGTQEQKTRAYSLIKEAVEMPRVGDDRDFQILLAQLALEFQDLSRFRQATNRLAATHQESQTEPPISGVVWDLFKDRTSLTTEMTSMIQSRLYG